MATIIAGAGMTELYPSLELLLSGLTVGGILVIEFAVWRIRMSAAVRWASLLFGIAVAVYALASTTVATGWFRENMWLRLPVAAVVCGDVGFSAVLVRAVFDDRRITWRAFLPSLALIAIGLTAISSRDLVRLIFLAGYFAGCVVLLIQAAAVLVGGWRGDLVEARRRLRRPAVTMTLVIATAILIDVSLGMATRLGWLRSWLTLGREAVLATLVMAVAVQVLAWRGLRLPEPGARDTDDAVIRALRQAVENEVWRREGLTLETLAAEVGAPEYRVRRAIVETLGHRNFPAFVNSFRIAEAKRRLAEAGPETVAAIAFDTGFNSLSAFNRAFREATGEPPTRWRKKMLSDS